MKKFRLLLPLPQMPIGTIITHTGGAISYEGVTDCSLPFNFTLQQLEYNKEWFEEIPEEPKFIKDRWYKVNLTSAEYYLKLAEIRNNRFYYSAFVNIKSGRVDFLKECQCYDYYNETKARKFILVEDSEVEPYLKPRLTFGGETVKIVKEGNSETTTYISCADFQTDLTHLKSLYDCLLYIQDWNAGHKVKQINGVSLPITTIQIGCKTGTMSELKEIIEQAEKI